jgi:hypothetical protein
VSPRRLRVIKPEIRVLGIDDGKFVPHSKYHVLVVGVVFRGGYWLDGLMSTSVVVDGLEATEKIADMIVASPHYRQLRVVMLNGITLAGFNVVNIKQLNAKTDLPVIAVTEKKPDLERVHAAINRLPDSEERWKAVVDAGETFPVTTHGGKQQIYAEATGITWEHATEVLRLTSTRSKIPEPLRVAHLVASGISSY